MLGRRGSSKEHGDNSIRCLRKFEITPVTMKACRLVKAAIARKYKVGDHLQVKLSGGRIVRGTVKAIIDMTDGVRLQVVVRR
jgi:hypothetical protein